MGLIIINFRYRFLTVISGSLRPEYGRWSGLSARELRVILACPYLLSGGLSGGRSFQLQFCHRAVSSAIIRGVDRCLELFGARKIDPRCVIRCCLESNHHCAWLLWCFYGPIGYQGRCRGGRLRYELVREQVSIVVQAKVGVTLDRCWLLGQCLGELLIG